MAEKKTEESAKPSLEDRVNAAVDGWISEHLRNSEFSQDTPAWNHFNNVRPALVEAVLKGVAD